MCGIVGAVGSLATKDMKAVQIMLQLDVIRGKDSTGLVGVDKDGKNVIAKEAWLPQDLLTTRGAKEILGNINNYIVIGHNRAATVGAVNKAGAHPFEFENVVGVHNGTTPKHHFLDSADFDVDSQALYNHLSAKGTDEMWKNMAGAASLAYFDKRTKKMHLLRNDERPMCIAFNKAGSVMYFASEAWMIHVACGKAKVDLDEKTGIKITEPNKLYSFEPFKYGDVAKFTTREIKPFLKPKVLAYQAPVLNTWAAGVEGLRPNQEVHFTIGSVESGNTAAQKVVHITTTSTKKPIKGRMYLYHPANRDTIDEVTNALKGEEFCADIASVSTYGANRGFVVKSSTCFSLELLEQFDEKNEGSLIIEGREGVVDREMFQKGVQVHNQCVVCDDPLNYDDPDFKFAGTANGKLQFVCDSCQDIATNLFPNVDLRNVTSMKPLTH